MANDDLIACRGGLLPVRTPYGACRKNYYRLTTSNASALYLGHPMDLDANGRAVVAANGDEKRMLGPVLGFLSTSKDSIPSGMADLTQGSYLPANTDAYVLIADDPGQLFMIQEDTGGTALAETNIGNTATWAIRTSSGNDTTGYSTVELDRSDIAADNSGALQVLGLVPYINSDGSENTWGNYAKLLVRINNHRLTYTGSGGAI